MEQRSAYDQLESMLAWLYGLSFVAVFAYVMLVDDLTAIRVGVFVWLASLIAISLWRARLMGQSGESRDYQVHLTVVFAVLMTIQIVTH